MTKTIQTHLTALPCPHCKALVAIYLGQLDRVYKCPTCKKTFLGREVITPAVSILAEPPVALVDKVAAKHGTTEVAKAYLEFLYSEEGQEIGAKNYYRPRSAQAFAKYANNFPKLQFFTVDDLFGGWQKAQKRHFEDGGVFDRIYGAGR